MATMTRRTGRNCLMAALGGASLAVAPAARAQDFPLRPITFVVGLGAGGGQDINSRIYADAMSRALGQRVVVDNKTGAGGGVGRPMSRMRRRMATRC
jgi:tripartite-type tricarboxylate transporter receptor subunit TctC